MSDTIIIAFLILLFLAIVFLRLEKPIIQRLSTGASFSGGVEGPLGIKVYTTMGETKLSEGEKKQLEPSTHQWKRDKSGHLYWFASDISLALPNSLQARPDTVRHYIRQCFWHATQLSLGDPIEGRFKQLFEKTAKYTVSDWNNTERRGEINLELAALLHAVAFIVEGDNFLSKPPDDWNKI